MTRRRIGDLSSPYGYGMVFPPSWSQDPPEPPDSISCPACGEDRYADDSPCEHCGHRLGEPT